MGNPEPFEAGSNISTCGLHRPSIPIRDSVALRFPGRIHATPMDCNRFDFGQPGGGGIGFAIEMENRLEASLTIDDVHQAPDDKQLLLKHVAGIAKSVFAYRGGLGTVLHISESLREHGGFGSTTAVMTAGLQAMNLLFGSPLSRQDVRKLVAYNFVEVSNGKVARAMETGVGTYVILFGGVAVIGDQLCKIHAGEFLPDYCVGLVDPGSVRPAHQEPENIGVFLKSQSEDLAFRYQKAYTVMMDLVPALCRADARTIGDILWRFQFSGTNLFLIQNYHDGGLRILRIMTELRQRGVPIVGMSSVGPTIYALCADPEIVIKACTDLDAPFVLTRVDNTGIAESP